MGLTFRSADFRSIVNKGKERKGSRKRIIAIAGNPNVGKSTIFNALTGMHQHTGNWPGKTVSKAQGNFKTQRNSYVLIDIPGTYSLNAHSAEEEVARDFLCFEQPDAVLVVCDATCLEKNLNLVLQIMEINRNVMVCVNLLDEARLKGITVDTKRLSFELGVPVIGITAQKKKSINRLVDFIDKYFEEKTLKANFPIYNYFIEDEIKKTEKEITALYKGCLNNRWLALKIIENDDCLLKKISVHINLEISLLQSIQQRVYMFFEINGYNIENIRESIVETTIRRSKEITEKTVTYSQKTRNARDRKIDSITTGKWTGIPIMMLMVALIFWITISGANYLSEALSQVVFFFEDKIKWILDYLKLPQVLSNAVVYGGYRVFAWVASVMLPPMAIFFPFFTLLEDSGYLARIAYNLDKPFNKCNACGKQALTMCMGFGCNAVGVTGARIIDSPRERLLAIVTNSFMPCNGRFPMLITIITIFFVGLSFESVDTIIAAGILSIFIFLAVLLTFGTTKILSKTLLKGMASSYVLELPSYRKPQIGKVIIRSIFDRTIFVLGRAVIVAIPAGFIIWGMGNIYFEGQSVLELCSNFLEPVGLFLGLDGEILLAFILGTPANEIVIPILLMLYSSGNILNEVSDYSLIGSILTDNGWNIKTAICMIFFAVFHWPCATTLFSVKKETGSVKWTLATAVIPTFIGALLCIIINFLLKIFM